VIWFWKYFQTRRLVQQDNIYDLAFQPYPTGTVPPIGFVIAGYHLERFQYAGKRFFAFNDFILRGNFVRNRDGAADPWGFAFPYACVVDSIQNLVVEDNIINVSNPKPIIHSRCGALKELNNQTTAGKPVRANMRTDIITAPITQREDLFDTADDWLLGL
jgi:hypothetical protein